MIGRELGLDKRGAIDWAKDWLGGDFSDYPKCPTVPAPSERDDGTPVQDLDAKRRQDKALAIWNEAIPTAETLAETYLMKERGLPLPPDILAADAFRFHPSLNHDGNQLPGKPTIVRVIGENKSRKREIARTDHRKFARSGKI